MIFHYHQLYLALLWKTAGAKLATDISNVNENSNGLKDLEKLHLKQAIGYKSSVEASIKEPASNHFLVECDAYVSTHLSKNHHMLYKSSYQTLIV